MSDNFYAKGTIKIKNADGVLEPFLPTTDFSCVDNASGTTLIQTISNITSQIAEAENSGGIELMYEEPTDENTTSFSNETLIGYILPETWSFTVDTSYISQYNEERYRRVTGIPIDLYYQDGRTGIVLDADWGDGSVTSIKESDFTYDNDSIGIHQYAENGTYKVSLTTKTPFWETLFLDCTLMGMTPLGSISSNNSVDPKLQFFKASIVSVDSKLPRVCGMYGKTRIVKGDNGMTYYYSERTYKSLCGLFYQCPNLKSIPKDIFVDNDHITNFSRCFLGCHGLTDFEIYITSPDVETAEYFVSQKSGARRIVHVPQGSTTQTTFNSISNSLGLTIIGE